MLLPHLDDLVIVDVRRDRNAVTIEAAVAAGSGTCPQCGSDSARVHSRYRRQLADVSIAGSAVVLRLRVRRFFCPNSGCAAKTFAEQVAGLTVKWARRTSQLAATLTRIGLALAGRAGARLAGKLGIATSRDTLLRLVRALPDPPIAQVQILGVDDFSFRRGHTYGTVVVDMQSHRPIEVLADRTAATLAQWLRGHAGVEVVCRDRASAYAEAVKTAAPHAIQVADRWHLWHNLAEAVDKTVVAERAALRATMEQMPEKPAAQSIPLPSVAPAEGRLTTRTRERYAAVRARIERGDGISAISRELRLDRKTVRRFARADTADQLLGAERVRDSLLDPFRAHLHDRLNTGCRDAATLAAEIRALGYRGSVRTVRRYVQPLREHLPLPAPIPAPPTVRQVARWMTCRPDRLTDGDRVQLKQVLECSEVLRVTHRQVREFADIMTTRTGNQRIQSWITRVTRTGAPALRTFARGLRSDIDAVTNGLTLPHSSGAVEGSVTRIKHLKRSMYGRAKFDLLRIRILHPN
ncbi:ISL3 family transposase [Nocardia sp. NPDC004860]|uniref:ISL3 family transposase n=2 Tax=unclassified Nocardia TaxID=2637762 RepID=UPI0033BC6DFC